MEEDLIIGDPSGAVEFFDEENVEFELEDTPDCAYVNMGLEAYTQLESIDTMLMSKEDQRRIARMKRWSIFISHYYMKLIYDSITDQSEEDDG
jgi:hypothetical protein